MGRYMNPENKEEVLLNTDYAFPKMTLIQLEGLLIETQLEIDKRTGINTKFRFKAGGK